MNKIYKILVVDDDPTMLKGTARLVESPAPWRHNYSGLTARPRHHLLHVPADQRMMASQKVQYLCCTAFLGICAPRS